MDGRNPAPFGEKIVGRWNYNGTNYKGDFIHVPTGAGFRNHPHIHSIPVCTVVASPSYEMASKLATKKNIDHFLISSADALTLTDRST